MSSIISNEKYDDAEEEKSKQEDTSQVVADTLGDSSALKQKDESHHHLQEETKSLSLQTATTASSDHEVPFVPAVKTAISKSITLSDAEAPPAFISEKMVMNDEDEEEEEEEEEEDDDENVKQIPNSSPPPAMMDEKASYKDLYETAQPSLAPSLELERKLPAKPKPNLDDEKALYRMDNNDLPSMQPSIALQPSQQLHTTPTTATIDSRHLQEEDEKAAYRPAAGLAMAPSLSMGPTVAAGAHPSLGNDLSLSKTPFDGISVAQGRHDLVRADELFAAEVATEAAASGAKDLGGKSSKGGVATISPGRGQRVPRATAPGVEYIRRRAPGMRPSWYSERLSRSSLFDSQQPSEQSLMSESGSNAIPPAVPTRRLPAVAEVNWSIPKLHENRRGCYIAWAIIACVIIGVALGVGLGVTAHDSSGGNAATQISQFAPFSKDCNTLLDSKAAPPHVLTQCYCSHTISIVPKDIAARYTVLSQSFIPMVDSNFKDSMDSCSPKNQALVWLASGDGSTSTTSSATLMQRYRLAILFILWNGPSWGQSYGWLSQNDECSWFGLSCNGIASNVDRIKLSNANITGTIPLDAAWLLMPSLTGLDLSQNEIQTIQLSNTTILGNQSSLMSIKNGTIPMLTSLDLSFNQLNGTLPLALSKLAALQKLQLGWNNLQGTIPTEFGLLRNLTVIDLSKNRLTGQIPTEIGRWNVVEIIELDTNNFTTTLPTEIGHLLNLAIFQVFSSGVQGSLPTELFHNASQIWKLDLGNNFLTGTIPTEVGNAFKLVSWHTHFNNLTGTIPPEMGKTQINDLLLQNNNLHGTVPSELGLLPNFQWFDFSNNPLTGTLPSQLCYVSVRAACNAHFHCFACACVCTAGVHSP